MVGSKVNPGAASRASAGVVAALAAIGVALVLLALAPLGWRLGLWSYPVALFTVIPASACTAAAALALAAATIVLAWSRLSWRTLAALAAVLIVGQALVYLPWHYSHLLRTLPPINDITTDPDDRPGFEATLAARDADSEERGDTSEPELSRLQKAAYPDIAPLRTARPVASTFATALAVARAMPGWTVVAADRDRGRIEASARTRWFGFTDDIVIRVRPEGGGSRVDARSASRIGGHDIGANAARIRTYVAALRSAMGQ
jgi:uncharacterized protein (DUF1499 family)